MTRDLIDAYLETLSVDPENPPSGEDLINLLSKFSDFVRWTDEKERIRNKNRRSDSNKIKPRGTNT